MSILERDSHSVWHPYTSEPSQGPKTVWERAEGAYVYDETGKKFFDATASWWCQLHGHCHPRLVQAMTDQAKQLDQVLFAPHTHPTAVELADRLSALLGMDRVFFSDDGSTAVEAGLKMALQYWHLKNRPKKRLFLSLTEGYHGDTLGAVSVGYVKEFHHFFDGLIQPMPRAMQPYCYRCPLEKSYPGCDVACLQSPKEILESRGEEIAALVIEPLVMGAAGMVMYPEKYLDELVRLCRANDVLIMYDEVFTGFGRTGKMFAQDWLEERPDISCLAKGLTSGMLPLGATLATDEIYQAFTGQEKNKFYHGHTFTANAISCAVALENLKIFEEENVLEKNLTWIDRMAQETERFRLLPHVGEVRQKGMIWAIELVLDKESKTEPTPLNGPGWKIAEKLWEKGLWTRPLANILYLIPPYCLTEGVLKEFFDELYREVKNENNYSSE